MPSANSKPTQQNGNGTTGTTVNNNAATAVGQQRHQSECCSVTSQQQQQNGNNNNNYGSSSSSNNHHGGHNGGGGYGGGSYHLHHHHNNHHYNNSNPHRQPTAVVSLNPRQVDRLRSVLDQEVQIHGRENFPTLEIPLHTLIVNMRRKLREANLQLKHVKLNGGAASFVFAQSDTFPYSDVDLIFPIALQEDQDFERVRDAVFDALLEMMPSTTNKAVITADTLRDVYIRKMVKVTDGDRWSLFSLHNDYGRCIELKFVEQMRRQFEFSVDSFQITLDPIIDRPNEQRPNVRAESMYGDFMQSLYHLNKRLIDTRNPEEIRGGGLLKYCHLLTRGFCATANCRDMEKYMCSRFFIDFPDINVQEMKLLNYLQNHFGNEDELKYDYLHKLFCVIRDSTVCLMYHERRQTLAMVDRLRQQLSYNLMLYYQQFESNANTASAQQQQQYYTNQQQQNNGTGQHNGGGRSRRYGGGNSQRYWQNSSRHNNRNNNGAGPMLCVSPVSTIASSSIVEDEQQQQQQVLLSVENGIVAGGNKANDDYQQQTVEKETKVVETIATEWRPEIKQRNNSGSNSHTKNVGINAIEQSQPVVILTKHKNANNRKESSQQQQLDVKRNAAQKPVAAAHIPRQTLLYLPPNSSQWIPVV